MSENLRKAASLLSNVKPSNKFEFGKWRQLNESQIKERAIMSVLSPQTKVSNLRSLEYSKEIKTLTSNCKETQTNKILKTYNVRFPNSKVIRVKSVCTENWLNLIQSLQELSGTNLEKEREARIIIKNRIVGMGWKTTSDFLKDIGFSKFLAILDSRNLKFLKAQKILPENINANNLANRQIYYKIEETENELANHLKISVSELDELIMTYTQKKKEQPHKF